MSAIEEAIRRHRQELAANEQAALRELMQSFDAVRTRLLARVQQLVAEIDERQERDQVVPGSLLLRQDRAVQLLTQVEQELAEVAARAVQPVSGGQASAVELGTAHALTLLETVAAATIGGTLDTSFNRINRPALEAMVGRMSDGAPLQSWLAQFGPETAASLREALQSAAALGTNPRGVARVLARQLDIAETRLLTMARTEILGSYREATLERYRQNGDLLDGWFWVAARQTRTCLACLALDGRKFPLSEPFQRAHVNCFVAGTLVSGPTPVSGTERWYSGQVVEIETEHGRRLTVTPNHPVLTPVGWVAAGLLNEGSYLIGRDLGQRVLGGVDGHDDDVPPAIEEVARTLRSDRSVFAVRVPTTAEDFHGDGIDGDVSVVTADRELWSELVSAAGQHARQFDLIRRVVLGALLPPKRQFDIGALWPWFSSDGIVRSLSQALAVFWSGASHAGVHALAAVPWGYPGIQESYSDHLSADAKRRGERLFGLTSLIPSDDLVHREHGLGLERSGHLLADQLVTLRSVAEQPAFRERGSQAYGAQSDDRLADGLHPLAGDVAPDRIVKLSVRAFTGHVYNLETEAGWYFANGIIAHNCRCSSVPAFKGETRLPIETAREWFGGQPEALQRSMVPPTAWEDFRAGRLTLDDFVHLDRDDRWGDRYRQASVAQARANAYLRTQITRAA